MKPTREATTESWWETTEYPWRRQTTQSWWEGTKSWWDTTTGQRAMKGAPGFVIWGRGGGLGSLRWHFLHCEKCKGFNKLLLTVSNINFRILTI